MTSARDDILGNIRRSLGVKGSEATRKHVVEERLQATPKGVIPARGQVSGPERLAVFRQQAELALATVAEVESGEVPLAVAEYLRNHNLPAAVRMGDDPRLRAMPWDGT